MAPPKRPWFRLYVETIWDRKIRRLTPSQRWLWVAILALARQSPLPGILILSDDPLEVLSPHDIADAAALKEPEVRKGLERFVGLGLIVKNTDLDAWEIARWNDRQYESDVTANRTAKHRRKNVPSPNDVTPPDTETESEADSEQEHTPPQADGFDAFWDAYPPKARHQGEPEERADPVEETPRPKTRSGDGCATHLLESRRRAPEGR